MEILCVHFTQDVSCCILGTSSGFQVYTTNPLSYSYRRDFSGGIGQISAYVHKFALVGGGSLPLAPSWSILVWDDLKLAYSCRLDFSESVLQITMRAECLVAVLHSKIQVLRLLDASKMWTISTLPSQLSCVSADPFPLLVACADKDDGRILVNSQEGEHSWKAHNSPLSALAMTPSGSIVASTSVQGTIVRVFNTNNGSLVHELRRGLDPAFVYTISLHPDGLWLACLSDKATLHVFGIGQNAHKNRVSLAKGLSRFLPSYFSSLWSFASFRVKDPKVYFAFRGQSLVIVNDEACFNLVEFDLDKGGECQLVLQSKLI